MFYEQYLSVAPSAAFNLGICAGKAFSPPLAVIYWIISGNLYCDIYSARLQRHVGVHCYPNRRYDRCGYHGNDVGVGNFLQCHIRRQSRHGRPIWERRKGHSQ